MAAISASATKLLSTKLLQTNFQIFLTLFFFFTSIRKTSPGQTGFQNFALSTDNKYTEIFSNVFFKLYKTNVPAD